MPIEVKQLVVKGTIDRPSEADKIEVQPTVDLEAYKEEILEACRRLVEEVLQERGER